MCIPHAPRKLGNASSVQRISQLRGRGGLAAGPGGIGFGAPSNPGGLEGANAGSVRSGKVAQALITVIAGAALFVFSRGKSTGEYDEERAARRLANAPPSGGR